MFTPEFRNRLDATIAFSSLTPEVVRRVVDKFIMQLEEQLADRSVAIALTDTAAIGLPNAATMIVSARAHWRG